MKNGTESNSHSISLAYPFPTELRRGQKSMKRRPRDSGAINADRHLRRRAKTGLWLRCPSIARSTEASRAVPMHRGTARLLFCRASYRKTSSHFSANLRAASRSRTALSRKLTVPLIKGTQFSGFFRGLRCLERIAIAARDRANATSNIFVGLIRQIGQGDTQRPVRRRKSSAV